MKRGPLTQAYFIGDIVHMAWFVGGKRGVHAPIRGGANLIKSFHGVPIRGDSERRCSGHGIVPAGPQLIGYGGGDFVTVTAVGAFGGEGGRFSIYVATGTERGGYSGCGPDKFEKTAPTYGHNTASLVR